MASIKLRFITRSACQGWNIESKMCSLNTHVCFGLVTKFYYQLFCHHASTKFIVNN